MSWLSSKWNPIFMLITAAWVVVTNMLEIIDRVRAMISMISSHDGVAHTAAGSFSAFALDLLAFANYVIPLDLVVACFTLYVPFLLWANLARIVKAFIPTIA